MDTALCMAINDATSSQLGKTVELVDGLLMQTRCADALVYSRAGPTNTDKVPTAIRILVMQENLVR